jgi:hypothetical protein
MHLPIYKEIQIKENNSEVIFNTLINSPIGTCPCYINLENIPEAALLETMNNIQAVLVMTKNSWHLPYPIYIISSKIFDEISIKQFNKKSDLPGFFNNKSKKLNTRELQLLQMNQLKATKFKQIFSDEKMAFLKSKSPVAKALKLEIKKTLFFEKILTKLSEEEEK